ncbi:MAG TPA: DUF6789 family protein [Trueperaceae bacterium]
MLADGLSGALSGALATLPMTAFMMGLQYALPPGERYPLPPRRITAEAAGRAGALSELSEPELDAVTMLVHFGIGASMGGFYGLVENQLPGPPAVKGAAFGLAVWAGGYLGALPAMGLLPSATRHPPRRRALMIAAHLVYGSALGMLEERLRN